MEREKATITHPIGDLPVVTYGTALAFRRGNDEYYAGTVVGFVVGGSGALILDTGEDGLQQFSKEANQHLYLIRTRYDELVTERNEWKKRALEAEAKK